MISLSLPIKAVSLTNQREHWATRASRARAHREAVAWAWRAHPKLWPRVPKLPCVVTITRVGPRILDSDNLQGAGKHVRDEVARQIGVDDADPRIVWRYEQERGKGYEVRVEIE